MGGPLRAGMLVAAALVCAAPLAAQEDREALFVRVIAENGCAMTTEQAAAIMPRHGFDMIESRQITKALVAQGRAFVTPGGGAIRLIPALCP